MDNKKISTETMLKNLGKADITSLVNFNLLKEYFHKNNLKVKNVVTQRFFNIVSVEIFLLSITA
jgi:SAM-dependent MidA family methyltransferase